MPVAAGVSHVHTSRSDGTGTADEVAAAAGRAGLTFIIFTDHGDGTRAPDPPQYRHGVLCLDGVEISTADGHYLAVGMPVTPYPLGGEARDVIEDVGRLGGFGIVAHPDSLKGTLRWQPWTDGVEAIEWLNGDTEWRDETFGQLARALATYPFRAAETLAALLDRPESTLRRWDELTRRRPVVALAGSDAHARVGLSDEADDPYRSRILLRLPSYQTLFSTFSIRVELARPLSGDASLDATALVSALRSGRAYSVVDAFAAPAYFDFVVRSPSRQARQGESIDPDGPIVVEAESNGPPGSSIALFRDGQLIADRRGPTLREELPAGRAVLRAEVRLDGVTTPWIVGNPVYVAPLPREPAARPAVTARTRLDEPDAERRWHVEQQSGAAGALERAATGPAIFRYQLVPDVTTQSVALVLPEGTRLREFDRVSFRGTASAPMRVSVQLRKPSGADGQRWRRSVYLDTIPRDITVFFADMTPAGPTDAARPDLKEIQDLLFVVDTTNTRPGTAGTVTIEALHLER